MASRNFKRFWFAGLLLLAVLIVCNIGLMVDGSPMGVVDHQSAGTATKVDAIQQAWSRSDKLNYAKANMLGDLVFIGVYSFGALCGGLLMRAEEGRIVKHAGNLVIMATAVFFVTDLVETVAQIIQLFTLQGADNLARLAASVGTAKVAALLITLLGLGTNMVFNKMPLRR